MRPRPKTRSTRSTCRTTSSATTGCQQMQRVAEVAVNKGPLAGRVDLKIENVENTVQAQINSLNNIIAAKPDAILDRRRLGRGAQPDDQEGLRRRHRRHQLRPGRDRAVRLRAQLRLGPHPHVHPELAGQCARRQGQDHRRPRPRRRADLGSSSNGDREVLASTRTSRSSASTTRTTRSGRSRPASPACSPRTRRSTAS